MKRLALTIGLFLLLTFPGVVQAACVAPIGPGFDTCPASNPNKCYIYNDQTGTSDLTCCAQQSECQNFQQTPTPGTQTTGSSFSPFTGCSGTNEINTAIGCIPTDPQGFVAKLLSFGIGIAGGIAFLLILLGGFQILTSAGNPERLQGGRELVGAAISGLLLIIFSLFLLRLIGFNILGIPDFG